MRRRAMANDLPDELPKANNFGDFWLGPSPLGPAIFASNKIRPGKFFASTGPGGVIFDGPGLRYFDSAQDALVCLRDRLNR